MVSDFTLDERSVLVALRERASASALEIRDSSWAPLPTWTDLGEALDNLLRLGFVERFRFGGSTNAGEAGDLMHYRLTESGKRSADRAFEGHYEREEGAP